MKSNAVPQTITAGQVPPYCYRLPGMSAEAGALAAIKALNISHPCDAAALALFPAETYPTAEQARQGARAYWAQ